MSKRRNDDDMYSFKMSEPVRLLSEEIQVLRKQAADLLTDDNFYEAQESAGYAAIQAVIDNRNVEIKRLGLKMQEKSYELPDGSWYKSGMTDGITPQKLTDLKKLQLEELNGFNLMKRPLATAMKQRERVRRMITMKADGLEKKLPVMLG